jgi:hypothetical protein
VLQASPDFSESDFLNLTCGKFLSFALEHLAKLTASASLSGGVPHSNKAGTIGGSLH